MTTPVGSQLGVDFNAVDALNAGFITREDASLKAKLQGIKVPVANEARVRDPLKPGAVDDNTHDPEELVTIGSKLRTVPVYFRLPEDETRRQTYPYITIDFLGAMRDQEREHRGVVDYHPSRPGDTIVPMGMPAGGGRTQFPIPMRIEYQITQWARYNRHDRQIMVELAFNRLQERFGWLEMIPVDGVPDDGSIRRLDLLSGPTPADTRDEEGKRLFRKVYTVGVSSEWFPSDIQRLGAAGRLNLDLVELDTTQ